MTDLLVPSTMLAVPVTIAYALLVSVCSLVYLRRVRLDRPPVGVFNGRDVALLYVFIIGLPMLYVVLPQWALTGFLIITFAAALSIGYRPVVPRSLLWPAIGLLIGMNIWIAQNMLGSVAGWQVLLAQNSFIVLLAAVAVANLYVQGGMRLKHVAMFAMSLAVYDLVFLSFTVQLADAFIGKPLNPSMGFRVGIFNVDIGLGDLLVYGLFTIAAFKAYGKRAARIAMGSIAIFGALLPASAPLIISEVTRGNGNAVTPAQVFFGPAAVLTYWWLRRRYGPERTYAEFLADTEAIQRSEAVHPVSPAVPRIPAEAGERSSPLGAGAADR